MRAIPTARHIRVPFIPSLLVLGLGVSAEAQPVLKSALVFGGPGNQRGMGLSIQGDRLRVAGWADTGIPNGTARLYGFTLPLPAALVSEPPLIWSLPGFYPGGIALGPTGLFLAGSAYPPTLGAADGVGGTESKSGLARFDAADAYLGGSSPNFFPYRGSEGYSSVITDPAGGCYAGGGAEQAGSGYSNPFVLARHDATGAISASVSEPGVVIGSATLPYPWVYNSNYGYITALTLSDDHVYAVGGSRMTGLGEDNIGRPMLVKFTPSLSRVWKVRADPGADYPGYQGYYRSVAALDGCLYAVGGGSPTGGAFDFLIEKYDASGSRVWSTSVPHPYEDLLTGVLALNGRIFATGYSCSEPASQKADAVLLEVDPATGTILSTTTYGGALDDRAWGIATNGQDLFVVGESSSSASAAGNLAGQSDVMLLQYSLNRPPQAEAGPSQTVGTGSDCQAIVHLDASGSTDPDGDELTYAWEWASGSATGQTADITLPRGTHSLTLTVGDGHGASATDTLSITVSDLTPPVLGEVPALLQVPFKSEAGTPVVLPSVSATDACDGSPVVSHDAPALFPIGMTTVAFTAKDASGNVSAPKQLVVQVFYPFTGYLNPILAGGASCFKAGRTIPIKFQLRTSEGSPVSSAVVNLQLFQVSNTPTGTVDIPLDPTAPGASNTGTLFRFDPVEGIYLYNLSTKGFSPGTYLIQTPLGDGQTHRETFSIR